MGRTFLLPTALAVALIATIATAATAQSLMRCEVNGKVVYSDAACAPGSAAKAIVPVQETAEQRAAARAASDQVRKDTAYVDKRLDDRYKRDTARPMGIEASAKDKSAVDAGAAPKRIAKAKKSKTSKKSSKKAAAKAAKRGNASSRPAPQA